jgi:hypothetical protein
VTLTGSQVFAPNSAAAVPRVSAQKPSLEKTAETEITETAKQETVLSSNVASFVTTLARRRLSKFSRQIRILGTGPITPTWLDLAAKSFSTTEVTNSINCLARKRQQQL